MPDDYLAWRDWEHMADVFGCLGLRAGLVLSPAQAHERRHAFVFNGERDTRTS